jgi:hypothetical protein
MKKYVLRWQCLALAHLYDVELENEPEPSASRCFLCADALTHLSVTVFETVICQP